MASGQWGCMDNHRVSKRPRHSNIVIVKWGTFFDLGEQLLKAFYAFEVYLDQFETTCYLHLFAISAILLHWYNSECSFPSQRMKCGWSWSVMVVVVRIWRIIIVGNAHWIRVTKKFSTFSVTNGMKNTQISKFTFDFFTERDGLNGYFWLQFIEKGIISQMCNGFLFMNAWSWKYSYLSSEWRILHIFVEPFIFR